MRPAAVLLQSAINVKREEIDLRDTFARTSSFTTAKAIRAAWFATAEAVGAICRAVREVDEEERKTRRPGNVVVLAGARGRRAEGRRAEGKQGARDEA